MENSIILTSFIIHSSKSPSFDDFVIVKCTTLAFMIQMMIFNIAAICKKNHTIDSSVNFKTRNTYQTSSLTHVFAFRHSISLLVRTNAPVLTCWIVHNTPGLRRLAWRLGALPPWNLGAHIHTHACIHMNGQTHAKNVRSYLYTERQQVRARSRARSKKKRDGERARQKGRAKASEQAKEIMDVYLSYNRCI